MLKQAESPWPEADQVRAYETSQDPILFLDDVVRYAFARLGSREEAEDVAMEVFQAAFRLRSELPRKADPKLYLIGITRRKIADHLRARKRQRGPGTVSLDNQTVKDAGYEISHEVIELVAMLDKLPELQRDALVLKYLMGFTTEEVAKLLGKTPQAANSLLQRAREAMS